VGDASNVSEDHAVSSEPMGADRIEVVRGPATLMYGGNAIGGVVNVLHGRIPDHVPDRALTGSVEGRYGSGSEERTGSAEVGGGIESFAWHLAGVRRETDDTSTPIGDLVNSDMESTSGSAGASWVGDQGFVGLSFGRFETNYGIPNPDEPIRIDLEQNRWDAQAEWSRPLGFLRGARLRFGMTDYEHAELEDTGEVGTRFLNDAWEGRLELPHQEVAGLRGSFGVQASDRELEAIGEEAFVPPTTTETQAAFLFEEFGSDPITVQLGARYEDQDASAADPLLPERSFDAVSGAAGLVWKWAGAWSLAGSLARTTRFPTAEELYANGPHLATFQFEVGDPDLQEEEGLGIDLSLRRTAGRVHGELNLFHDDFDNYIFLQPTGIDIDLDGELIPEFRYVQSDARFRGAELHVDFELVHTEPHHVELEVRADTVRADDRVADTPLPRIPPHRYGLGLHYQAERLWARLEGMRVDAQDRIAPNETPTDSYTMVDAVVGYRIIRGRIVHDLLLRGTNLTDETARNHLSALKDVVVLPGRDVSLGYKLVF
jgi:iron complex outermembrane receptor protein